LSAAPEAAGTAVAAGALVAADALVAAGVAAPVELDEAVGCAAGAAPPQALSTSAVMKLRTKNLGFIAAPFLE